MKNWKKYALTAGSITVVGAVGIITTNMVLLNNAVKKGDAENTVYYASNLLPLSNTYENTYYSALGKLFYEYHQKYGTTVRHEEFRNIVKKLHVYKSNHVDAKFLRTWVDTVYALEYRKAFNDKKIFDAIGNTKSLLEESTLEHKILFYSLMEERAFVRFCNKIDKKRYIASTFEEELALVTEKNKMYQTINMENILNFSGERSYDTMIFKSKKIDAQYSLKLYDYWKNSATNKEAMQQSYEELSQQLVTYPEYKTQTYRNYEKLIPIIYEAQKRYEEYKKIQKNNN